MAEYNVSFTDSTNKGSITVETGGNTDDTSLSLVGPNDSGYGTAINTNFLHLLENFANNSAPSSPVEGQLWYDTTTGTDQLKIYDGTNWVSAGNIKKALTEPDAAISTLGDLWVDTTNQQVYLYSGSGWVLVGPDYSDGTETGAKIETFEATDNLNYTALVNYANNKIISIYSSITFTPKAKLTGFPTGYIIKPGVNIPTEASFSGAKAKYYGTAEKAELFVNSTATDSITFDKIVRKDKQNDLALKLRLKSDQGLSVGENDLLQFSVSGSTAIIRQFSPDGNIDIKVNDNGINTTALRVTPQGRLGVLNLSPEEALDVTGNIKSSGKVLVNSNINSLSTTDGALTVAGGAGIAKDVNIGGTLDIVGTITHSANILPDINATRNLGSATLKYDNAYANTFTGNLVGGVTGNVSGSAGSAARLNSPTSFTFNAAGDVYQAIGEATVSFDGQSGGASKQWTLRLNPAFVSTQTAIPNVTFTSQDTDSFLVNRGGTLYKMTHTQVLSKIPNETLGPVTPVGSITAYIGAIAPNGWAFCRGQPLASLDAPGDLDQDYELLGTLLSGQFGTVTNGSYWYLINNSYLGSPLLPDFRGRMMAGHLADATTGNRLLDDPGAGQVGGDGGARSTVLTSSQLPDHKHSLLGDNGVQYYATTAVTGGTDTGAGVSSIAGTNPGTQITQTGAMVSQVGAAVPTVPPFITVEYIIFTGVFS